jgi:hypothetical protein
MKTQQVAAEGRNERVRHFGTHLGRNADATDRIRPLAKPPEIDTSMHEKNTLIAEIEYN